MRLYPTNVQTKNLPPSVLYGFHKISIFPNSILNVFVRYFFGPAYLLNLSPAPHLKKNEIEYNEKEIEC